jgi:hypothetical protein
MNKINIPYCEFYITNVCNMGCVGCNRFNNFNFTGFQKWEDYAEVYKEWSQQVDFKSTAILGGEPLLNPTIMSWLRGVSDLWPKAMVRIISNGTRLDKVAGLYDLLHQRRRLQLWVGIHNKKHKKDIIDKVENFLTGPCTREFHGENTYQQYLVITDANGLQVRVEYNWWFHQGAVIQTDGVKSLHTSDPEKAHAICHMQTCHHFIRGKLYKCGVVALLPEFDQQHPFAISSEDRQLMNAYQPLSIDANLQTKQDFITNLPNAIDQCKFCPEAYNGDQIFAEEKKNL